ncbi:hypothetical protein pipiens_001989 [Culex pipiens pipiens]|uniref:Uncharacterized protein n=1 Tax=Culex pipiens pipiens TaxID=38569 RepID=A0ABD1DN91_CULPP
MARPKLTPVIVLILATVSMGQSSSEPPATNKTLRCPRVGYQYFFKNLNQSVLYRVELRPHAAQCFWGVQLRSMTGSGTCDVYTGAWRDFDNGDLRVIRSELELDGMRPDLEFAFGIEKQGGVYYWCDPERRQRSRFKLVPMVGGQRNVSIGTEVCSADYRDTLMVQWRRRDDLSLEQIMIRPNDPWATQGSQQAGPSSCRSC